MSIVADIQAIMPMLILTLSGLVTLAAEAFRPRGERVPMGGLGLIGLVGAAVASFFLWNRDATAFGVVRADNFALFVNLTLCLIGILTIIFSADVIDRDQLPSGEYHSLILFTIVGMMLMASAIDLLVMFLALEILSLGVYVLTAIRRTSLAASEGGFKYFLLGAFSSAFFLYGVALIYALAGSTRLDQVAAAVAGISTSPGVLVLFAVGLLMVGFAFKIAAVPFHMWAPDAYQGAPTLVTAFMSTAVKVAAMAAFVRVFLTALDPLRPAWAPLLGSVAIATMIVGTVVGVAQTNVKRMLAYSSIAHSGYLLIGVIAANAVGKSAILFYLLAYALANIGAFAIIALLATPSHDHDELADFGGLWQARPWLAVLMTVFLLSLGGFPPLAGFIAKWYIFAAAVQEGYYALAIVGVLTSVVSVFYYLRIVVSMFMSDAKHDPALPAVSPVATLGLAFTTVAVVYFGVLPTGLIDLALRSIETIF